MRRLRLWRVLSLEDSPIGRELSAPASVVMAAIALALPLVDLALLEQLPWDANYIRAAPACLAVSVFVVFARGRLEVIGARFAPLPSLRFWVRAIAILAILFGVIIGIGFAVHVIAGIATEVHPPRQVGDLFLPLVEAPLVEEAIYRWAMVTGLAALANVIPRRWAHGLAIGASGAAFGYLHFVYGSPAANNVAAGFVFAWMYLRSGSIVVPIAFHALGNAAVAVLNLAASRVL